VQLKLRIESDIAQAAVGACPGPVCPGGGGGGGGAAEPRPLRAQPPRPRGGTAAWWLPRAVPHSASRLAGPAPRPAAPRSQLAVV
jgi:hypothetical protein